MSFWETLGQWMTQVRESHDLSQLNVAEQLGKDQPAISKIEKGQRRVSVKELLDWADLMGLSDDELAAELALLRRLETGSRSIWVQETTERETTQ